MVKENVREEDKEEVALGSGTIFWLSIIFFLSTPKSFWFSPSVEVNGSTNRKIDSAVSISLGEWQ